MRRSSSAARGPVVSQPERSVSATAVISSSPIAGGWKPSIVARWVSESDESFDIHRLEPNHRLSPRRALERLLAAVPDRQDRTRAVGAAPKLTETVAGTTVDANAANALLPEGLLHPDHLLELARRRHEEMHAGAADAGDRSEARGRNLLAERGGQGCPVQVDAEGDPAELGVVTSAEPRRELAHPRPVGSEQHLCVARALRDPHPRRSDGGRFDGGTDLRRLELARPDVCERNAERWERRRQPVRDRQRTEVSVRRERIDRDLASAGPEQISYAGCGTPASSKRSR